MRRLAAVALLPFCLALVARADDLSFPTLELGAKAPEFKLKGVDDREYSLDDFAKSKLLVIVFTCNHCPTAQAYETRLKKLVDDYKDRSVAVVAISPNDENSVRLDELGYTDLGDSFEDMKIREAGRVQLPLPVRRRQDRGRPQVRPDGHPRGVRLRLGSQAAIRGPDR